MNNKSKDKNKNFVKLQKTPIKKNKNILSPEEKNELITNNYKSNLVTPDKKKNLKIIKNKNNNKEFELNNNISKINNPKKYKGLTLNLSSIITGDFPEDIIKKVMNKIKTNKIFCTKSKGNNFKINCSKSGTNEFQCLLISFVLLIRSN